jgi:hypothetical protein
MSESTETAAKLAERRQIGGTSTVKEGLLYKAYRVHVAHFPSGLWLSMIVSVGKRKVINKDSLTPAVTRVPEEYESEAEALEAAKRYIDREGGGQLAEAAD